MRAAHDKQASAEATEQTDDGKLIAVEAVEPIQHDGEHFAPGETFRTTRKQAQALIDAGYACAPRKGRAADKD